MTILILKMKAHFEKEPHFGNELTPKPILKMKTCFRKSEKAAFVPISFEVHKMATDLII